METKKIDNLEIRIFSDSEELSHYASQLFTSASFGEFFIVFDG